MGKSSRRGILVSITLLFSIMLILIPSDVYAEEVNVKSIGLEETTILEITNNSNKEIDMVRIWLAKDFNFESFKTEKGWIGEKTPQGVIVFTSSGSIKLGEIVKFGVKTDKPNLGVNWKILDKDGNQMDIGKTLPKKLPAIIQNPNIIVNQIEENNNSNMFSESTFMIIPEKPNKGSTIRVVGDKFQPSQIFDFYIDTQIIGNFSTDENGHFITTMKIPEDQKNQRIDLKIIKNENELNKMSIRLGENQIYTSGSSNIELTLVNIPDKLQRGDTLEISGTGTPNGTVTIEIARLGNEIIHSKTAEIDGNGNWKLDKPIIIALDAKLDKYSIKISDRNQNIMKQWNVISNKTIIVESSSLRYDLGDLIKITGEVLPNVKLEVILEDPLGKEIVSDIVQIDNSGHMEFGYKIEQTAIKGTYKIIMSQGKETDIMFVGVGQQPEIPVDLKFDKLNYLSNDIANITLVGKSNEIINLLIMDPADNQKGEVVSITLLENGRYTYELDLAGYASGVYTAIISKGSTQNSEMFTVGLQIGSGDIKIQTTKTNYMPGETVLILGETAENILLEITLLDANENKIKIKESFSNKEGKISDSSFKIPNDALPGTWKVGVKSGSNFDQVEIEVISSESEGIQLVVEEGLEIVGAGKTIQIKMTGVKQNIEIKIISSNNKIIDTLAFPPSEQGEIDVPWIIPKEMNPGTYTVIAKDAFNSAETTFEVP